MGICIAINDDCGDREGGLEAASGRILARAEDISSRFRCTESCFVLVWVRDSFNFTVYDCKEQRFRVMSVDLGEMHKRLGAAIKVQP